MSAVLTPTQIRTIRTAAVEAQLTNPNLRDLLLAYIDLNTIANLPVRYNPQAQLLSDLQWLNQRAVQSDGTHPLAHWLQNAVDQVTGQPTQRRVFEDALVWVSTSTAPSPTELPERILFRNDTLPSNFAARLAESARSVVHLTVPLIQGGTPVVGASGQPSKVYGTGWVAGPSLLMTAYHVINAQKLSRPPTDPDVHAQATQLEVRLDYEFQRPAAHLTGATLLAADEALDYAVLRLAQPCERAPLTLPSSPLQFPHPQATPYPLNIIQHPGGGPKRLAIRNNLFESDNGTFLRYFTDTAAGSSGSPVLNDQFQVVGLHTRTVHSPMPIQFQGNVTAWINAGTRMDVVLNHLQQHHPALHDEIRNR